MTVWIFFDVEEGGAGTGAGAGGGRLVSVSAGGAAAEQHALSRLQAARAAASCGRSLRLPLSTTGAEQRVARDVTAAAHLSQPPVFVSPIADLPAGSAISVNECARQLTASVINSIISTDVRKYRDLNSRVT
jgi:hypothetical protein